MGKKKDNRPPRNIQVHKINPNTSSRREGVVARYANRKQRHKKW